MTLTDSKSTVGYFVVCPSVRVYLMVSCGWIEVMHFQQDAVLFSVTHIKDALLIFNKEILNVVARECVYLLASPPASPTLFHITQRHRNALSHWPCTICQCL